jgi:phenylacetate-CoA ligase
MNVIFDQFMKTLQQTEWGSSSRLVEYQEGLIANLVNHAYQNVPFYRNRLACLYDADGRIDHSRWNNVPIVSRVEAAACAASMRAPRLGGVHGDVTEVRTSGSTGAPLSIASTMLNWLAANASRTRMASWWGLDTSRPLARIRVYRQDPPVYPEGRDDTCWSYDNPEASTFNLDLRTPVEQQIEWLLRKKAPYLATSPSNAMALAYAVTPDQARELGIEFIFGVGETVLSDARELVQERLGARMGALYSCEEVGTIATQCPHSDGYHVVVENTLVEILNADGSKSKPGEVGQVVLTGFYNYAMPFIRYAIGDVAVFADAPCPCGRSLPLVAQVLGRTRCAFVFSDGTRVWPRAWDARAVAGFVGCKEFQMVQVDHRRIELRYIADSDASCPSDPAGLQAYVRDKFHPSAEVVLIQLEAIPRGPGGKFEPFMSLVGC